MTSIIEMPGLVLDKIIGFSDFKAVLTLRQVCRDFRNFIDDLKDSQLPDSKLSGIEINCANYEKIIEFALSFSDGYFYRVEYSETEGWRNFVGKMSILENANIVDVAIQDLEQVMKFQKSNMEKICLELVDLDSSSGFPINDYPLSSFAVKLINLFQNLNRKIKTTNLSIRLDGQSDILSILSSVDPETLETLELFLGSFMKRSMGIEIDEIVKTEQWKKLKEARCYFCALNVKVEDVCHFSKLTLSIISISAKELDFLRKVLNVKLELLKFISFQTYISSSKFDFSHFSFENFNENEEISNLWGPAFVSTSRLFPEYFWYFRMKDSEEKILRIRIQRDFNHINFENVEMTEVPNGAIVQNYNDNNEN